MKSLEMIRIFRNTAYNGKNKGVKIKLQKALIIKEWVSCKKRRMKTEKKWVDKRKIRTNRAKKTMRREIVLGMESLMLPNDVVIIKSGPCQVSGFPSSASGKESACLSRRHKRHEFDPWVGKIPWSKKWHPAPLSCLENCLDRGDWWSTVHGVTEFDTTGHMCVANH